MHAHILSSGKPGIFSRMAALLLAQAHSQDLHLSAMQGLLKPSTQQNRSHKGRGNGPSSLTPSYGKGKAAGLPR